jgi:hypothetical protein
MLYVDSFRNIALNRPETTSTVGVAPGHASSSSSRASYYAVAARTFADAPG